MTPSTCCSSFFCPCPHLSLLFSPWWKNEVSPHLYEGVFRQNFRWLSFHDKFWWDPIVCVVSTPPNQQLLMYTCKIGFTCCTYKMPGGCLANARHARVRHGGAGPVWKVGKKKKILSRNKHKISSRSWLLDSMMPHSTAALSRTKPCGGIKVTFL